MTSPAVTKYIERQIAKRVIAGLVAAGHAVSVYDDRNEPFPVLAKSRDPKAILAAMFTTDEDLLTIDDRLRGRGENGGWVWFVHGNGDCVVSDYTTNLEYVLSPVNAWVDAGFPED